MIALGIAVGAFTFALTPANAAERKEYSALLGTGARPSVTWTVPKAAGSDERVTTALGYLGDNRKVLLVFARYVPGLRFVVDATFGLSDLPYRQFLPWSALGGLLWATYTCVLAYWVGATIEDYPVASMMVSGAITTALIALLFLRERRRRRHARPAPSAS